MPSFDKNAFLSIKKWYVSFIFHLKGKGEATKIEGRDHWKTRWDILREVSGTFDLDKVQDHRPKNSALAPGERRQGRFISWGASVGPSSVSYLVADRVEHESVTIALTPIEVRGFTKFQGAGTTQIGRSKEFRCDLKDMLFDMEISSLQVWNRERNAPKHLKLTGEYHSWTPVTRVREDIEYPLGESEIFGILPEITEPLLKQCFSRKLELVNDKIEFSVSVPVTRLPYFPDHSGSNPGGSEMFNHGETTGGPPLELSLSIIISPTPPSKAKLVRLTVTQNATQENVIGEKNWATVQAISSEVTVEVTTAPHNNADEWKQIHWSGDTGKPVPGKANSRKLSRAVSKKYHVEASLGGVTDFVDVWILWATIEILTTGTRPANAAPFDPGSRDETDKLGAVTYKSLTSSVVDERAGVFVNNTGASGKIVGVATLSPKGVYQVVVSGWSFERQVWTHNWIDGVKAAGTNDAWTRDTSQPRYLRLKPDANDKIYDLDGPDIRWGKRSAETYNNFRQWIEWNNEKCSEHTLWYWQARWRLHEDPSKQISLNDLGAGKNISLPDKPLP